MASLTPKKGRFLMPRKTMRMSRVGFKDTITPGKLFFRKCESGNYRAGTKNLSGFPWLTEEEYFG